MLRRGLGAGVGLLRLLGIRGCGVGGLNRLGIPGRRLLWLVRFRSGRCLTRWGTVLRAAGGAFLRRCVLARLLLAAGLIAGAGRLPLRLLAR